MWLNSLHSYSQWPGLLSLNNDRSWKNATIFCLHTFDFLMTGAGNSDNCFVFTLSLSWWPEPEKKQKLFCLHTFTFMELFFNQSQGLTGIRLFLRAGIYKSARCRPAPDYTSSLTSAGSWCCYFCPTSSCGHLLGNSDPTFYVTFHAGGWNPTAIL